MQRFLNKRTGRPDSSFLRSRLFVGAFVFCALVWLLDPLLNLLLMQEASPSISFDHSPTELYFRTLLSALVFGCAVVLRIVLLKYRSQNRELSEQRENMQRIISSEPECVKTVAQDGSLLDMNPAGLNIIEADSIDQVRYASVYDLIAPENRQDYITFNERIFRGESGSMEYDIIGLKGARKCVETHAVPLLDESNRVTAHLAITRDITAFKQSQKDLKQFSVAVEQCASVVMITDTQARLTYVNPRFESVTGYSSEEALGQTPRILRSGKYSPVFYQQLWARIGAGRSWRGKMQNRRKNGELYWVMAVISPIKDEAGDITHFLCTQEDVTNSHNLTEQLDYQARHCMLTGLINRYEFEQRLTQLLERARTDHTNHAVFFLDIDQFKVINDTCGHIAGDQLLRQLGSVMQAHVRQHDSVSRLGGDEFAVLLEYCVPEEAVRVAEKLRLAIDETNFAWGDQAFRVSASIGVVCLDSSSPGTAEILSYADTSCYMAKEQGRNRIYLYQDDEASQRRQGEMQWITRIHEGIEKNQFCLYVQDIVGLQQDKEQHYEVLLRYREADGSIIAPGAFLPSAERYGLSPKLDRWVINRVCAFLAKTGRKDLKLSINLSGLSIADTELLVFVRKTLQHYQVEPAQLCFEITETAAISNLGNAIQFINAMKEIGCRFALDDFGSGLSSFGYLKNLPVDFVKIDGIFVKDILIDQVDLAMVRSINDIGHLMGKKTIAEFVENAKIAEELAALGVDYGQGYGIAKPYCIEVLNPDKR